jgi:UDP-N-acetyl-2-amino-2-deoxyglucuronate dehydrogenase
MQHRVGLIGLGMAVNKHALALRELADRVTVAGAWSPTQARREAFSAAHAMPVTETLDAIIDDPSINLVFILTPPWTHLDLVERLVRAGKHVLLEKPVEATLERAEQVVRVCKDAGKKLGIVFQNRFRTPHLRLDELLKAGRIGPITSASVAMRWWRPAKYFAEPGRGMKERDGGGVLLNQGIHSLDQLVALLGQPSEVCGFHATSPLRRIDTEDVAAGAVRWAGGAIGTLDATTTSFPGTSERIDIAGEHGSATLERTRLRAWLQDGTMIDVQEESSEPAVERDYVAHRRLIEDMLDAIETGREPGAVGESSLGAHRLIDALMRSGESGRFERV